MRKIYAPPAVGSHLKNNNPSTANLNTTHSKEHNNTTSDKSNLKKSNDDQKIGGDNNHSYTLAMYHTMIMMNGDNNRHNIRNNITRHVPSEIIILTALFLTGEDLRSLRILNHQSLKALSAPSASSPLSPSSLSSADTGGFGVHVKEQIKIVVMRLGLIPGSDQVHIKLVRSLPVGLHGKQQTWVFKERDIEWLTSICLQEKPKAKRWVINNDQEFGWIIKKLIDTKHVEYREKRYWLSEEQGSAEAWDHQMNVISRANYKRGRPHGKWEWFTNNQPSQVQHFNNGEYDGEEFDWWKGGEQLFFRRMWKQGQIVLSQHWDSDGTPRPKDLDAPEGFDLHNPKYGPRSAMMPWLCQSYHEGKWDFGSESLAERQRPS